jgi:uncharacterized repeat protein (TIGR02543 family)
MLNMLGTIAIEIGHGTINSSGLLDRGASGGNLHESELNLVVGLEIDRVLRQRGYKTFLNRTTEPGQMSLNTFYSQISEMNLLAGIAVHFNTGGGNGFEVYTQTCCNQYYKPHAPRCICRCDMRNESEEISHLIAKKMSSVTVLRDPNVPHIRNFTTNPTPNGENIRKLINSVPAPFAYCEFGFIDNPTDRGRFDTATKQRAFGKAAAEGIIEYLENKYDDCPTTGDSRYIINFASNGGTVTPTSAQTNTSGRLTSLPTPTRGGFVFNGWFTAASGGTRIDLNRVYTANTTIHAQWSAITVSFNPQSGTVSPTSAQTNTSGRLTSLPTPTRGGFVFNGWFTAASGGTRIDLNRVYTANTTIHAQWSAIIVTFNRNFTGAPANTTSTVNSTGRLASFPTNPTRAGFKFVGWFDTSSPSGGRPITVGTNGTVFVANATVFARWEVDGIHHVRNVGTGRYLDSFNPTGIPNGIVQAGMAVLLNSRLERDAFQRWDIWRPINSNLFIFLCTANHTVVVTNPNNAIISSTGGSNVNGNAVFALSNHQNGNLAIIPQDDGTIRITLGGTQALTDENGNAVWRTLSNSSNQLWRLERH